MKGNSCTKILAAILIAISVLVNSCIEDNIIPPLTGDLNPVGEMLYYFESNGDFANSTNAPALIQAEVVFANLNNFLIIDIRPATEFEGGHIENSLNVQTDSLFQFVESHYDLNYQKIVLISKNGHSSSYFSCLLRLAGFENVYTLEYGMASWNADFADEWFSKLGDHSGIINWTNNPFPKNEFTELPQLIFERPEEPLEKRVASRIKEIISKGFNSGEVYYSSLPSFMNKYPICYGKSYLYNARKNYIFEELGHPEDTRSYIDAPLFEFRSYKYLQTLPNTGEIFLYDYNGQYAASITAYLRVLGYDVRMLKFGANQLFYSRMIDDPELNGLIFSSQKIRNYPYVTNR